MEESGQSRVRELREEIRGLRQELEEAQECNRELKQEAKRLREEQRRVQFDRSYSYHRHDVVELAQLICKYLENKPSEINSSRIFDCHEDLRYGYGANPEYYNMDIWLLLNVCLASTWFSEKQRDHIKSWCRDQGWLR